MRLAHRRPPAILIAGLLSLAGSLAGLSLSADAAIAAPGTAWTGASEVAPPSGLTAGASGESLSQLSCPVAGSCGAAGIASKEGKNLAIVADQVGGVWQQARFLQLPEPDQVTGSRLESISCPATGECAAVGYLETTATEYEAIVVSETGGSWGSASVIEPPAESDDARLTSISCTGPGSCTAVGFYTDSTEGFNYKAFSVTEVDGGWRTPVEVPQPTNAQPYGGLESVSCPAVGACAAIGWYYSDTADSYQAFGAAESNGSWSSQEISIPGNDYDYEYTKLGISCAAVGSCGISGYYYYAAETAYRAIAASLEGGSWSPAVKIVVSPNGPEEGGEYAYLYSPSCAEAARCTAGGSFYEYTGKQYLPMVVEATAGSWGSASTLALPGNALTASEAETLGTSREAAVYAVSCWAAGRCAAVGYYKDQSGEYVPMVASETAGTWGAGEEIQPPANTESGGEGSWLEAISCAPGGHCGAVGTFPGEAEEPRAMAASGVAGLRITGSGLPAGQVGVPYHAQLGAEGGAGTYSWGLAAGALPAGLSLDSSSGVVSGTPTGAGASGFTVALADPGPPSQSTQQALSITIAAAKHRPSIKIKSAKLTAKKGKVRIRLACAGATCKGVARLTAAIPSGKGSAHASAKGKKTSKRTLVLARGSYRIAAGKARTVSLRLTAGGRRQLAALGRRGKLPAKLTVTVAGGKTARRGATIS